MVYLNFDWVENFKTVSFTVSRSGLGGHDCKNYWGASQDYVHALGPPLCKLDVTLGSLLYGLTVHTIVPRYSALNAGS